jgi:hypothetical protein
MYVFHLFLLKEKGGAKKFKANPNGSACFAGLCTTTVITTYIISLLRSKVDVSFLNTTFSNSHAFPLSIGSCTGAVSRFLFLK